jgi:regulator of nucleoside diphosphate kinase
MKCPQCQAYIKEGAKFCGKCGSKLSIVCPQCGAENDRENNFCNECGHNLRETREAPQIDFSAPQSYHDRSDLKELERGIRKCKVVDSKKAPPTVVTMNSKVKLRDLETNGEMIFTLVFPKNANIDKGRISVMSPIGTAILGYSVGDSLEWPVPAGKRKIKIEEMFYQPEAAGDYHL